MAYTTIDDPSAHFQVTSYSGNGSTQAVANAGNSDLQPDWVWIKERNNAISSRVFDSSRGVQKRMFTNNNSQETTQSNSLTAFSSDGFSLGDSESVNGGSDTYIAMQWKAGGASTSTNNDGDVATTVQANTTAGFSIMTYTGNNTGGSTLGHGLGAVPDMLIAKPRVDSKPWTVYHKDLGNTNSLNLNDQTASADNASAWGDTTPSSSIVTVGNGDTNHTGTMVMYAFTPIQGYSKFGSYTGNGNADGPFVYTGFKPSWVMIRNTINGEDFLFWSNTLDNVKSAGNPMTGRLKANDNIAEVNGNDIDFLSNGFKIRTDSTYGNGNGNTIIYMAFAHQPFVSSEGVPTTAR